MSVATDGQPHITAQGLNNTLEYWSVDNNGVEETPHNILTGISLQTTGSNPTVAYGYEVAAVAVLAVVLFSAAILTRQKRRRIKQAAT